MALLLAYRPEVVFQKQPFRPQNPGEIAALSDRPNIAFDHVANIGETEGVRRPVARVDRWIQNSSATPRSLAKASRGVGNPRHFRGVVLSVHMMSSMS